MLQTILLIISILYLAEYGLFCVGLRRVYRLGHSVPERWPRVSVLVAARNEEANIERCVRALMQQSYPSDRLQFIVVDDDSEDATHEILLTLCEEFAGRLTVVRTRFEETHARGKALAIAQGMDHAEGDLVLLTDADCTPPTDWVQSVVEHFLPDVDVVGGFTLVRSEDLFSTVQQLDWVHLQTMASAGLAFNVPLGLIGNNFSFRRRAYDAVGGYRAVRFTVTEDYALFRAMHRAGHRVIFPCTLGTSMLTEPCASIREVLRQKQRWSRGGTETGVRGYAVLAIAVAMMLAVLVAPFVSWQMWAIVWGSKFTADLAVMYPNLRRLGRTRAIRSFLPFEFYFLAQAIVVPVLLLNRSVVWKGRTYRQ